VILLLVVKIFVLKKAEVLTLTTVIMNVIVVMLADSVTSKYSVLQCHFVE